MRTKRVTKIILYIISFVLLIIFIRRLFYTISLFDEVCNTVLAYRVALGQKPLIDIWEFHQTGAFFEVPFVYFFTLFHNGTDGIILFMRLCYLGVNLIFALILYWSIKRFYRNEIAVLICLIVVTYAPFSLYYLWYDTAGILFMFLGAVFLLFVSFYKAQKKNKYFLFFSGMIHACMCYAYPSFIVTALGYFVILILDYKSIKKIFGYLLGGGCIALIFICFVAVNREEIFFFNSEIIKNNAVGREYLIKERIFSILSGSFYFFQPMFLKAIVLLYIFFKGLTKGRSYFIWRFLLLYGIILVPLEQLLYTGSVAIFLYFFWIFLWTPVLYFGMSKEHKKIGSKFLLYLWFPSIISFFMVGFTALGGGAKSAFGVYTGAVAGLLMIGLNIMEIAEYLQENKKTYKIVYFLTEFCLCVICISNIRMFYLNGFENQSMSEAKYKVETGIFQGIYTKEEDKIYEEIEKSVWRYVTSDDKSIFFADKLQCGYLFTNLIPATPYIWDNYIMENPNGNEWDILQLYFDTVTGYPDIIVCREEYFSIKPERFSNMLKKYYTMYNCENGIFIFLFNERADDL